MSIFGSKSSGRIGLVAAVLAAGLNTVPPAGAAGDPHAHHQGAAPGEAMPCHEPAAETAGAPTSQAAQAPRTTQTPQPVDGLNIPDVALRDQEGREVHFYRDLVEGKAVLINFVFTTCTTVCPPMGATFGKVQKLLGERSGRDVHLISVSVDSAVDTPERLKAWAARFGAGPGWTLVTGAREDVDRLLKALAVYTPDKADHSPLVLAGNDAAHRWTRAYGLARPEEMISLVDGLAPTRAAALEVAP